MGRLLLILPAVAVAVLAIVLAVRELNESAEVTEGRDPGGAVGGARTVIVRIVDNEFRPANVSLRGGQTVRWVNADDTEHTVSSLPSSDMQFDSGTLAPDDTFEQAFEDLGTYRYRCTIHSGTRGEVTVLGD